MLSRFLSRFLPQSGNIFRGIHLKKDFSVSYTSYAAGFIFFSWVDTLLSFIIAFLVILIAGSKIYLFGAEARSILIVLIILSSLAPFILKYILGRISFQGQTISWIHSKISDVLNITASSLKDTPYMLKIIGSVVFIFTYLIVMLYLCFLGFGISVSMPSVVIFYALFNMSMQINITPGGNLGIQEVAYGFLCEALNIGMNQGIIISIMLRFLGILITAGFSLLFMIKAPKNASEMP